MTGETVKNSYAWNVVKEKRQGAAAPYEVAGVRRDDGLTITCEGGSREKLDHFLCKGDFGEFKFSATRWDDFDYKPLDKYVVMLFWPYATKDQEDRIRSLGRDIESALMHFPVPVPYKDSASVENVVFQVRSGGYSPSTLKHASEL